MGTSQDNAGNRKRGSYDQRRERAIGAAAKVFADKGYHGATTRDIAALLGIRQGSLYYYFESKEEALEEVCLHALREYVRRMEAIAASDDTFVKKIHRVILSHLSSYRDDSEGLKVYNDQRQYLPPERLKRLGQDGSRYRYLLTQMFVAEVEAGRLASDTNYLFATQSLIGLCNGWGDHIIQDQNLDVAALAAYCTRLVLKGMDYRPGKATRLG